MELQKLKLPYDINAVYNKKLAGVRYGVGSGYGTSLGLIAYYSGAVKTPARTIYVFRPEEKDENGVHDFEYRIQEDAGYPTVFRFYWDSEKSYIDVKVGMYGGYITKDGGEMTVVEGDIEFDEIVYTKIVSDNKEVFSWYSEKHDSPQELAEMFGIDKKPDFLSVFNALTLPDHNGGLSKINKDRIKEIIEKARDMT